jgi:hypothetical protein
MLSNNEAPQEPNVSLTPYWGNSKNQRQTPKVAPNAHQEWHKRGVLIRFEGQRNSAPRIDQTRSWVSMLTMGILSMS